MASHWIICSVKGLQYQNISHHLFGGSRVYEFLWTHSGENTQRTNVNKRWAQNQTACRFEDPQCPLSESFFFPLLQEPVPLKIWPNIMRFKVVCYQWYLETLGRAHGSNMKPTKISCNVSLWSHTWCKDVKNALLTG